jgi:hypothetical protein
MEWLDFIFISIIEVLLRLENLKQEESLYVLNLILLEMMQLEIMMEKK